MTDVFVAFVAIPVAEPPWEVLSLWAIRIALLLLVGALTVELLGKRPTDFLVAGPWLVGAVAAAIHSVGALVTFHHGSHNEALRATGEQTAELMGVSFAAGLYFNYVFVLVWLVDAVSRVLVPARYVACPVWLRRLVVGFLVFIAFNGAVVFKAGIIRWVGIACTILLTTLVWIQRSRVSPRREMKT
jgi:hypothetical protein